MQINHEISPLPSVVVAQRPVQDWWTLDPCCPGHRNTPGPSGHAPPRAHPRGPSYEVLYHTGNTAHCLLDLQTINQAVVYTHKHKLKVKGWIRLTLNMLNTLKWHNLITLAWLVGISVWFLWLFYELTM